MSGIYIHIPFCSCFCTYCGFYSEISSANGNILSSRFRDSLAREQSFRKSFLEEIPSTLYLGGGTPSVLPPDLFSGLISDVMITYGTSSFDEFTVEVNPEDIAGQGEGLEKILSYKKMGVNRISMGIQSFCDEHLKWMNRRHTAQKAKEAFFVLRECGFNNISVDLIFGYHALTDKQWEETLKEVAILSPEHISCYQLGIEPESALYSLVCSGEYKLPEDEKCAAQYAFMQDFLRSEEYIQYEVSNFCKKGREALHNGAYWDRKPYIGLGPAAHSFDGKRLRSWNISNLEKYCNGEKGGFEELSDRDIFNEKIMLGLRKVSGIDISTLIKCAPSKIAEEEFVIAVEKEFALGNLLSEGDMLKIPERKLFISDSIIKSLIIG